MLGLSFRGFPDHTVPYQTAQAPRVAAVLAVLLCALPLGCRGDQRALSDDDRSALLAWSGVRAHRGTASGGSDLFLLTVRPGDPLPATSGPTAEQPCIRAQAFLPGPPQDPRVFYLVDGGLYVQARDDARLGTVRPLPGLDSPRAITDLLAFENRSDTVEMLALVRKNDQEASHPWLLNISADRIARARPAGDVTTLRSKQAFFDRFHVPRCKDKDSRCVVAVPTGGKAALIVEEPRRGQPSQPVAGFDNLAENGVVGVKDAAWVAGDSDALYLAVGCRATGQ